MEEGAPQNNPYDMYTNQFQQYNSEYEQMENTYEYVQAAPAFEHHSFRPSSEYLGLGDFVVSDDDEDIIHVKHSKKEDFEISDSVHSSNAPPEESSEDCYAISIPLKDEFEVEVLKTVKCNGQQKQFEVAISNDTYLYYAEKYNDKHGLGEASLTKRRSKPKRDSVAALINACKK